MTDALRTLAQTLDAYQRDCARRATYENARHHLQRIYDQEPAGTAIRTELGRAMNQLAIEEGHIAAAWIV